MRGIYALSLCLLITALSCKKKSISISVERSDITESVYASGKIKAIDQYNVYASVNGVLLNIPVSIGDIVSKGQPLFELDNMASILSEENARLARDLSEENNKKGSDKFQEVELSVKASAEKLKLDSTLYYRQKKLWEENIGTELELEQKKLAYENSQTNYKTAQTRRSQLKTQLQNEQKRAGINYDLSKKLSSDFLLKSIIDGKVYDILKDKGELVTPQMPLAVVGRADTFLIELQVDENDILNIDVGQRVIITMDSYKGQVLEAVVDKIYPIMNERSRTFTIEAHFIKQPEKMFPNLSVEANIIIQTKKNSITIPNSYLIDGKFVLVDKNIKREVKVGLKDYQKSEILEGLQIGEIIYKP